jgi:hypothetical protein
VLTLTEDSEEPPRRDKGKGRAVDPDPAEGDEEASQGSEPSREREVATNARRSLEAQILICRLSEDRVGEQRALEQLERVRERSSQRPVEAQEQDPTQEKTEAQKFAERYSQDPLGEEFRPRVNNEARRRSTRLLLMMMGDGEWF